MKLDGHPLELVVTVDDVSGFSRLSRLYVVQFVKTPRHRKLKSVVKIQEEFDKDVLEAILIESTVNRMETRKVLAYLLTSQRKHFAGHTIALMEQARKMSHGFHEIFIRLTP